ncbi:hypothetical protein HK097_006100 [Rhizophlyctis rosea]|uniref:Thioredoxin n=1 Tax=Rhizophlyctis rosea TaxID=64517 RepID=A0AAD5SD23_9FUNG|nr:hypothetical protein HK097_006100 [Rhizophlyctis rosea]
MSDSNGSPVKLYVYDLSQGMARMLSVQLTGRQIDGIWHTSVVVYGKEYYFGQGILVASPGPYRVLWFWFDMGHTQIPQDVFLEYIDTLRGVWTADKYHLLDNNCNSFSNEVCNFLVGKNIPPHITSLPAEFLETPFGRSMLPMLENMFGPSALARPAGTSEPSASVLASTAAAPRKAVRAIVNLAELDNLIANERCVAVDFTSATCGPCRVISPEFERLVEERAAAGGGVSGTGGKIVGVKVEIGMAREIAAKYQISATPTFMFFLDGKQFHEFKGANTQELKNSLDLLLYTAYPPHPHSTISTRTLDSFPRSPILYTQTTQITGIFGKLTTSIEQSGIKVNIDVLRNVQSAMGEKYEAKTASSLRMPAGWQELIKQMLTSLPLESLFPVVDVVRLLVLEEPVREYYVKDGAFNIAVVERNNRENNSASNPAQEDEGIHEEWVSEMVAALGRALEDEEEDEIVLRLLASLGYLLRLAPGAIVQLAAVTGLDSTLDTKRSSREQALPDLRKESKTNEKVHKELDRKEKIVGLAKEVKELT